LNKNYNKSIPYLDFGKEDAQSANNVAVIT